MKKRRIVRRQLFLVGCGKDSKTRRVGEGVRDLSKVATEMPVAEEKFVGPFTRQEHLPTVLGDNFGELHLGHQMTVDTESLRSTDGLGKVSENLIAGKGDDPVRETGMLGLERGFRAFRETALMRKIYRVRPDIFVALGGQSRNRRAVHPSAQ